MPADLGSSSSCEGHDGPFTSELGYDGPNPGGLVDHRQSAKYLCLIS